MLGINGGEAIILVLLVLFIIGPERLPEYAEKLKDLVKSAKRYATGATAELKETLGPELADVDWRKLDPRQYDPRTIVRQALLEDDDEPPPPPRPTPLVRLAPGERAPFDPEAT
ncbi:Sec-independent protein translocase TatB [Kocuria sp. M1R5S2]|uniref:Sec-independent protein translocase TatB n=1 Tax=Kocuria rhizosphaerae TaxID=3376285 RepID=UPI0037AA36B3